MQSYRYAGAGLVAVLSVAGLTYVHGQQTPQSPTTNRLPLQPQGDRNSTVTPAFEGWYRNPDGTATILVGYLNRNTSQVVEIPVGPNNGIQPGGPDMGQPTYFEVGRQFGVFSITVPKDFGTKKLKYTINANNQPQSIDLWLNVPYGVAPLERADTGNTPPVVKFSPTGPEFTGPPKGFAETLSGVVGEPVTFTVWASDKGNTISQQNQFGPPIDNSAAAGRAGAPAAAGGGAPAAGADAPPAAADAAAGRGRGGRGGGGRGGGAAAAGAPAGAGAPPDAAAGAQAGRGAAAGRGGAAAGRGGGGGGRGGNAPIRVRWVKHRGPGDVKVADASPAVVADPAVKFTKQGDFSGKSTTTATFSAPGEYWVRGQFNDSTGDGGGGDQCCWTNVLVKVNIRAAGTPAAR